MITPEAYKSIVDAAENGIMIFDSIRDKQKGIKDFQCIYANEKAAQISNTTTEILMGSTLKMQLPEGSAWLIDAYVKVVETGLAFKQELTFYFENVGNVFIEVVTSKLNDGLVSTFKDITTNKRAHIQLVKSEIKYRKIFENVQDVFYQTDPMGIITEISPSIAIYSEYNREEIIGRPVTDFYYYVEDREKLQALLFSQGKVDDFEVRLKTKDNRLVIASVNCHIVKDEKGGVIGAEGSMRDISDRKAKEELIMERERKMKLFISQAPSAIAMVDTQFQYLVVSQRWSDDFSFIAADFVGKHDDVFAHQESKTGAEIYSKCLAGQTLKMNEDRFVFDDGMVRWYKWEVRPWYDTDGMVGGLLIFMEDISEQKRQQDEIRSLFKELQEINRQKDQLFSIIAHDLRGPLGTFTSLFDMFVENYDSFSKDEFKDYFNQMQISSSNVYQLLEDLLLWARNQLHKVSFEQKVHPLHSLAAKAIRYLEPQAEGKSIRIELDILPTVEVFADSSMVETVIRNLVSNAIKFSNKESAIHITSSDAGEFIRVSITDQGIGVKAEDLHKLFDKMASFTTYGTLGEKGTGIGLDLCRDFIEKNGGTIEVKSELGKGSTFSFTLRKKN